METAGNFISDLIKNYFIPTGVLTVALTYFFQKRSDANKKKEEENSKALTTIDTLIGSIDRISVFFEGLRIDAEQSGYFAFKNINSVKPMVDRIQLIAVNDIFFFEEDDKLTKEIVNIADLLSSLVTDVNNLENIAITEDAKERDARAKFDEEIKKLRTTLLKSGIEIDTDLQPRLISAKGKQDTEPTKVILDKYDLRILTGYRLR